ncbi:MAG: type IV pilus modification protein PilV [Pseudomonadota bacterium]
MLIVKKLFGSTLIEVLISALIVALGLASFLKIQNQSMKNQLESQQRADVIEATNQLVQKISNNPDKTGVQYISKGFIENINSTFDCITNTCSTTQTAIYDLREWGNQLATTLPKQSFYSIQQTEPFVFSINIAWNRNKSVTSTVFDITQGCMNASDIICYEMVFRLEEFD